MFDHLQHFTWTGRASICDDLLGVVPWIAKGALRERVWLVLSHLADGRERTAFEARLLEHASAGVVDDLSLDTLVRLGHRLDGDAARRALDEIRAVPDHHRFRHRLAALAELSIDERVWVEVLDGLSKDRLGELLGAPVVGSSALSRWLPLANAADPNDLATLGAALPAPDAARVLFGRRSTRWPPLFPQQLEDWPVYVLEALWEHATTLVPILREHPESAALAESALALPPEHLIVDVDGERALRRLVERSLRAIPRDGARRITAATRRVLRFAAHWYGSRDLVLALLDDTSTGTRLRTTAYQVLVDADAACAHAWALRTPWNALFPAARSMRLATMRFGELDARGEDDVRRGLVDASSGVRHQAERVVDTRPDGLARWRAEVEANADSAWAARARILGGDVDRGHAGLAQTWDQGLVSDRARSLALLVERDAKWRDTCESYLREPSTTRPRRHAAAAALARVGDTDARTRLLRVSLDPACECVAEHLAPARS